MSALESPGAARPRKSRAKLVVDPDEQLITAAEVALWTGQSQSSIYKLADDPSSGLISYRPTSDSIRFKRGEVREWIAQCRRFK